MSELTAAPGGVAVAEEEDAAGHRKALEMLDRELEPLELKAEYYFLGGAVIAQAFNAKPETAHVSHLFKPTRLVTDVAARLAGRHDFPPGWVSDAVTGYLSGPGPTRDFLELPNVSLFRPPPQYVLAVKCAAMRLGEDFQEIDDVRYALRSLNITDPDEALEIVTRYFGERQLAPETWSDLRRLLRG